MIDISPTLIGKSNRLNADDLTEEGRIITVTGVRLSEDAEQPLAVSYSGDGGRPYYPCTTMRRVIAHLWGIDGDAWKGRRLHLYRDPTVTFGKEAVGGIRIKAASHIEKPVTCSMTASRGKKRKVTIHPLSPQAEGGNGGVIPPAAQKWASAFIQRIYRAASREELERMTQEEGVVRDRRRLRNEAPSLEEEIAAALEKKNTSFSEEGGIWS